MEYNNLGRSGLKVSRICLGMMSYGAKSWRQWVLLEEEARPFVKRALEAGVNFFDTADVYSLGVSEEILGRAIKDFARRDEVIIATKVCQPVGSKPNQRGLSRKHIFDSIDSSLRRLGMDYVDLYQVHRWDPETPIEETLEALSDLVQCGKVRYLGASSMYAWQFAKALYMADLRGWRRFISMQNHYNLVYREEEREMLPLCRAEGIGVIPWSPLARGFLTGSRVRGARGETVRAGSDDFADSMYFQEMDFQVVDRVAEVAEKRGITRAQTALAWMLQKPGISAPIIGATRMDHLEQAIAAVDIHLSEEEMHQLEQPYQPHAVLGHK
jgi:aryl-alcohol dehydrogenase (NADP+)